MKSSLDFWRKYFSRADADIFGIIDHAIMVAASDYPSQFRFRRDGIAELLFSCRLTRCSGCNRVELTTPGSGGAADSNDENNNNNNNVKVVDDDRNREDVSVDNIEFEGEEENNGVSSRVRESSKGNSSIRNVRISDDDDDFSNGEVNAILDHNDQLVNNYSYGDAEALTDEIEEASQVVGEVLRIKDLILNNTDESDSVLFESLRRLQLMALTVDTLMATEIGKAVNGLRKHGSKNIRHLARTLVEGWMVLVDEWCSATNVTGGGNEGTPDSMNPSVLDEEEGLPSPPLDDFFATQTAPMELSQFFDGMDDDGSNVISDTRNSEGIIRNRSNTKKSSLGNENMRKQNKQTPNEATTLARDQKSREPKRQEALAKPMKPSTTNSGPGRPSEQSNEQRKKNESKLQQKMHKNTTERKPLSCQKTKFKGSDEVAVQMKLEATKRKLQESYQQAENAKRQRTIQIMELHDLPKPATASRNSHMRPGSHNRHGAHGRL